MIEIDCRKCKNASENGCKCYGKNHDAAVNSCAKDGFKNYKTESGAL